ncbi:MAG: hypothetical protein FJ398_25740 [Verrucomicrobia bacterium]|nr:hypothetical protein [Verrucomicrobiota bacterium]
MNRQFLDCGSPCCSPRAIPPATAVPFMKPPGLLLGATLLFWGWQTGLPWLGALAALLLESSRWVRVRWDFSQGDLDRLWNFCVALFFGVAIFAFASNDGLHAVGTLVGDSSLAERSEALNKGARSVLLFFQWLPLTFLPIALAQAFGERDRMDWSTFSWWLRRQRRIAAQRDGAATQAFGLRRQAKRHAALTPDPKAVSPLRSATAVQNSRSTRLDGESARHAGSGLNVLWPFFAVCLLAASAANDRTFRFPAGLMLLMGWALWAARPRRVSALNWSACSLLTILLGLAGLQGLLWVRSAVQRFESTLVARFASGRNFDPRETRTMLGEIGRLKLSGRIVLRVETDGQPPPELVREASYTQFKSPHWTATRREFANFLPDHDETSWRLLRGKLPKREATIATLFPGGAGLLALPQGAGRLEDLPAFVMETNRLGAVRMSSGPGFARFRAAYGPGASIDSAPDAEDIDVPPAEQFAIRRVAEELNLKGLAPEETLRTVAGFFSREFRYSTWLEGDSRKVGRSVLAEPNNHRLPNGLTARRDGLALPVDSTPLAAFLLKNRSGHCEYFATATTLLLRQAGIPARYAVGYSVQERRGRQWVVRERHAHAWCLAWVSGAWREIDATPAGWSEIEAARATPWQWISDAWSWLRFAIGEWRWGKSGWKQYLVWLIIPLLVLAGWRLLARKQWKRTPQTGAKRSAPQLWPGLDSEFYLIERKLAEQGLARRLSETLSGWLSRIDLAASPAVSELQPLLKWHYRLRFDPVGLNPQQRDALQHAVERWLSGPFHKYAHVRGKGFFGQTRRERRAYPEVDL